MTRRYLLIVALSFAAACGPSSRGSAGDTSDGKDGGTGSDASGSWDGVNKPGLRRNRVAIDDSINPFEGVSLFVNPDWVNEIETSVVDDPADTALYRKAETYPTAIWLDTIAKGATATTYLDAALAQQTSSGTPVLTTFVIYDLPDRDCAATASLGELSIAADGEALYRSQFIDPIADQFRAHPSQPIVAIIEPDSLPNLATNTAIPKCVAADPVYRRSVAYAISSLALPNVSLYIDAGHAGWLGWYNSQAAVAAIFANVLAMAGGPSKIRGFASDIANYNSMKGGDGATLEPTDPCPDELSYVHAMGETIAAAGIPRNHFIVDTSRSGQSGIRSSWSEWCNLKGAGLGERPMVDPTAGVDAYVWVKAPGESDGTSDSSSPRYDPMCGNPDAATGAPEAGMWFASEFKNLVLNASPAL